MEREIALQIVKKQLTEKRYIHTIGVLETAIQLAKTYDANEDKAAMAAIFHDYAKCRKVKEMKQLVIKEKLDRRFLDYGTELLHAPVGALLVKTEVGIKDEDILDGIRYHTTGRPQMSLLEKIVFIADYIEPNRTFSGVEEARELAFKNINEAIVFAIVNTIEFLLKKKQLVFPDTLATYNYLIENMKEASQ